VATLELSLATGQTDLHVRQFAVRESVSNTFTIDILFRSPNHSLDFDSIVGNAATFKVHAGYAYVKDGGQRSWNGIVSRAEQLEALQDRDGKEGHSTYTLQIVPKIWLLNHRRGNRIFQQLSIPDIVSKLLGEWGVRPKWKIDGAQYPKLDYKVQYAESDFDFMSRLLEEAGIAYTFSDGGVPVFGDALGQNEPRAGAAIPFVESPNESTQKEFVTQVRFAREVRPGAATFRDHDPRKPDFALLGNAAPGKGIEAKLEQYHYDAHAFLAHTGAEEKTPSADDRGFARHDAKYGNAVAARAIEASRTGDRTIHLTANTFDLSPGSVFSIDGHPHGSLANAPKLLAVASKLTGSDTGDFDFSVESHFGDAQYRPPRQTSKPVIQGLQSATVVGPAGQEIHCDEYGRVRVQFPWDREGKNDERSSCWIRCDLGWGGSGFGMVSLPRVGQEVLVSFLEGDPDCPTVIGRSYNAAQATPYNLPQDMTRSSWKSNSSPGSEGFNEIMFEDKAGGELVWQHAHKDRNRLVNNDEFATIGNDRQKYVKNDETERTQNNLKQLVGKAFDMLTAQTKNETIGQDVNQTVVGSRREQIMGNQSLTVEKSRHEKIEGMYALEAKEIHQVAADKWVGEADENATFSAGGSFISLGEDGIRIVGATVWINDRGEPQTATIAEPKLPFGIKR
jgi:type VI secretion system secreted protein VgrG